MKRWISLLVGIMVCVYSASAQANNTVQPPSVFVRSGPAETYIAIGALFQGDTVTPVNRSADSTWILVLYGRGTGWIDREGVAWQTDLTSLPILAPDVTPTPRATPPQRLLSPTPSAAQGFVLVSDGSQAFVRSGPLRGFPLLGRLDAGALVEPVSRNAQADWILIRFQDEASRFDGFGWIARDLVQWRDEAAIEALPVIDENNLTPTSTEDASIVMASATATQTSIALTTVAPPLTQTPSPTEPLPTASETLVPTVTLNLSTATEIVPSATMLPATSTPGLPTNTPDTPTMASQSVAQSATETDSVAASPTSEENRIIAAPVTATPILPTETPLPTFTPIPLEAAAPVETGSSPVVPLVALAGVTVAAGLIYLGAFARAMPELRRYEQGFVRADCPVCERGTLIVEEKRGSTLGIPSVRRTVRCNTCRSVLREKGPQRWTYAVDRLENPTLYERFNGREIRDDELKVL